MFISSVLESRIGWVMMFGNLKVNLSRSLENAVQSHLSQGLVNIGVCVGVCILYVIVL